MINAIPMHATVESEHLRIPELGRLLGKRIEVIIVEDEAHVGPANEIDARPVPRLGTLRGLVDVPEDFNDPLPDELALFWARVG